MTRKLVHKLRILSTYKAYSLKRSSKSSEGEDGGSRELYFLTYSLWIWWRSRDQGPSSSIDVRLFCGDSEGIHNLTFVMGVY